VRFDKPVVLFGAEGDCEVVVEAVDDDDDVGGGGIIVPVEDEDASSSVSDMDVEEVTLDPRHDLLLLLLLLLLFCCWAEEEEGVWRDCKCLTVNSKISAFSSLAGRLPCHKRIKLLISPSSLRVIRLLITPKSFYFIIQLSVNGLILW